MVLLFYLDFLNITFVNILLKDRERMTKYSCCKLELVMQRRDGSK